MHVILFFPVVFRVTMGNNLCRFALVSSPKQLTTCANCPRSLQSSSLGWVGVSDKTATTESLQNSLDPFMHAPRSRVFRFHYHHIPISWTETAQPCQRHPFFVAAIARLLWMPFGLGRHRIVWAQLAILITNLSAPSRKPFLWAPCKAQAFLILEDKPWEYYRIHNYIYIYCIYIIIYIYIYILYIYTCIHIYIIIYTSGRDSFKQVGILHQMFVKVYIVLSTVFSLHHASMALTRSPPSQHSLPCGSSLPRFLPAPRTWPHETQDNPRYPSHGHPICKRKRGLAHWN